VYFTTATIWITSMTPPAIQSVNIEQLRGGSIGMYPSNGKNCLWVYNGGN